MARWQSANVLQASGETRHLWQFSMRGAHPQLTREETRLPTEPLPAKLISKDWQTLYQPRLDVAWLPADKVFLRIIQLPPADTVEETASMIELQLEKLSPLPVAQVVWTFELLPKTAATTQTAIVVIAARHLVEEFLGRLETAGYLADRLEIPFIDQLIATEVRGDGVWIFPGSAADANTCLVAWWYGGVLQNVTLLHLPAAAEERGTFVREQIAQMAWAGELEGWLTGPPRRYLVAAPEVAAVWHPLVETPDASVEVIPPVPAGQVAAMTARRAAQENPRTNLVPPEYLARYRQQFVDRIWMRSLGAVLVLYLFGVVIYFAWLQVLDFKVQGIERQAYALQGSYTNALKLKAQVQVLENQLNLQFAALECYKAVAKLLPEGVTLDGLNFQRGRTLTVFGTADSQAPVYDFSGAMGKYMASTNELMFSKVNVPSINVKGNGQVGWSFACELKRGENE